LFGPCGLFNQNIYFIEEIMKTEHFFNAIMMAARVAVIFSVLTGCASTGAATGGAAAGGGVPDPAAERLASGLNAITRGSAKVEGGTVRLTDRVEIKTGLTVSAGVTLDLTAEGARLELKDGAILTVDGTVNARGHGDHGGGWVDGSLFIEDGGAAINGSGTVYLKSKGRLLNIWGGNGRKLTLEGVTLTGLPDNDEALVGVGDGGTLVMKSGAITGNTRIDDDWANGGGVHVWKGTFTMRGGAISGNTAKSADAMGGGVRILNQGATFTMEVGTISGNTAEGKWSSGGGVDLSRGALVTLNGGTIYGKSDTLPGGVDNNFANNAKIGASLSVFIGAPVKWGTGGIYTKNGVSQPGGSVILADPNRSTSGMDDTLIAIPAK
jgi:hypothetical protein